MVAVTIYVEGGGESKELRSRCREGFSKLVQHAGFTSHQPRFVACGGRDAAFKAFRTAISHPEADRVYLLLVDSEDPVQQTHTDPDSAHVWEHLQNRDSWYKPAEARNDQAQLMATCTETWIIADPDGLARYYGYDFQRSDLGTSRNLEARNRHELFRTLVEATRKCSKHYTKRGAFQVLGAINPHTLQRNLPHFQRFVRTLTRYLNPDASHI